MLGSDSSEYCSAERLRHAWSGIGGAWCDVTRNPSVAVQRRSQEVGIARLAGQADKTFRLRRVAASDNICGGGGLLRAEILT